MDEIDQKLLNELEREGFKRATLLAAKTGIGERTLQRRIRHMRHKGIIKVVALPNPVLLGYRGWATLGVKVSPEALYDVTRWFIRCPVTYFVAYTIGQFDIMTDVFFGSIDRLMRFVNTELMAVKGITSVETIPFVWPRKYYRFSWPLPFPERAGAGQDRPNDSAFHNACAMDETDRSILSILQHDGLTRPADMKVKLGLAESTIHRRVRNMLNKKIFSIEAVPNPEVLPYDVWAMLGIRINYRFTHRLIDGIIDNPAVYFASVTPGRFNLVICVRFHNTDVFNEFLKVKLAAVKGITSIEPFLYSRLLKYHNVDWSYLLKPVNSEGGKK